MQGNEYIYPLSAGGGGGGGAPEGTAVKSTGETSGKVLTSNGSGGASWQPVTAGLGVEVLG